MKPEPRIINGYPEECYSSNGDMLMWQDLEGELAPFDSELERMRELFWSPTKGAGKTRNAFLTDETARAKLRELVPIIPNKEED